MVAVIPQLLSKDQVRTIATKLFSTPFADGAMSGGVLGAEIKKNTQVPPNSPQYRELAELVMAAMRQNEAFNLNAMPRRILSPIFNSYKQGERYDRYIDAALMGPYPGMRTDLSITIFLNAPDAYKGGELVLESPFGEHEFKLTPGDAVLYPTHYMHRVNPITTGRRLAAVTWIESMIPDPQQREVLGDLAQAVDSLVRDKGDGEVIRKLEKGRLNLMRMWAKP
ncbi:MAG: Fe2+-dependent dioxygenase [Proteobacteria bacterium]|nr:Fe2+-dependent dioxygenase [Pseudomonadota bacterium]